jgi:lysophospholipase L1-like esterase
MPGQALAQDDLAPLIHSHRVKHSLCNVDPEYAHLWFHWTRLLWLYGLTDRALIVAHCSRSAQGRVHFITTIQRGYPLTYYNLGIRRETSADIAARWREECARRLPPTIDGRMVVSFGANDTTIEQGRPRLSLDATLHNLRAIVQDARRCYPTLLVGLPPVAEAAHTARIVALCRAMAAVAQELGVPYLPVCERLVQAQTWVQEAAQSDGAHPRQGGYSALAALVQAWSAWWFAEAP